MNGIALMERIVGIDPGTHHLGFGCISKSGNALTLIGAETINAPKKEDLYGRLEEIRIRLNLLLDQFTPTVVAIETAFAAQNVKSAFFLGIARGVVYASCMERKIRLFEYAPAEVKSVVAGNGRADKSQVQKMVGLILKKPMNMGFDASDALAIAICHASQNRQLINA